MKRFLLIMFCAMFALTGMAQNLRTVKGAVMNENDEPMSGVAVKAVNSDVEAITDKSGRFELKVDSYIKYIEASFENYITARAEVDGSYIIFNLKLDKQLLKEKAKAEAEAKAKAEAEAKRLAEQAAAEQAKAEAEAKRLAEQVAAEQAKAEAEAKRLAEKAAAEQAKAEAEAKRLAEKAAAEQAKAEAEAKAKAEAESKRLAEQAAAEQAKAEAEAKRLAEQAAAEQAKAEAEAKRLAEKAAAEKAKAEAEAKRAAEKVAAEKAKAEAEAKRLAEQAAAKQAKAEATAQRAAEKMALKAERKARYSEHISGYNSIVDATLFSSYDWSECSATINYIGGYRFNNNLFAGAGVGAEIPFGRCIWFDAGDSYLTRGVTFPLFAHVRANFLNRRCSPFFALSAGARFMIPQSISIRNNPDSYDYNYISAFINPQLGVNFRVTPKTSIYLSVGAKGYTEEELTSINYYQVLCKPKFSFGYDLHLGVTF